MILTVGRFSYMKGYGKGFDVLMNAMTSCPKDCSLYIVWDEPTPEFVDLKNNQDGCLLHSWHVDLHGNFLPRLAF